MAVAGTQVDDFVVGVEGDAGVEEGGGLQGCEDEVLGVVDEVSVGHFWKWLAVRYWMDGFVVYCSVCVELNTTTLER